MLSDSRIQDNGGSHFTITHPEHQSGAALLTARAPHPGPQAVLVCLLFALPIQPGENERCSSESHHAIAQLEKTHRVPVFPVLPSSQASIVVLGIFWSQGIVGCKDSGLAIGRSQYQVISWHRSTSLFHVGCLSLRLNIPPQALRLVPIGPCRGICAVARSSDKEPRRNGLSPALDTIPTDRGTVKCPATF